MLTKNTNTANGHELPDQRTVDTEASPSRRL
jgi:hypothetical protein